MSRLSRILQPLREALAGRYRVVREIGHGGMATVFLADNLEAGGEVAIKVLRPEFDACPRARAVPSRDRDPHAAAASAHRPDARFGRGRTVAVPGDAVRAGENLRSRLERDGQLPMPAVLSIAADIAAAIDYAHGENILHRDIKPENILLQGDRAVVCDFGLARAIDRAALEPLSSSGLVLGTPAYMSPEQAMGQPDIGAACDIYALGLRRVRDADRGAALHRPDAPGGDRAAARGPAAADANRAARPAGADRGGSHGGAGEGAGRAARERRGAAAAAPRLGLPGASATRGLRGAVFHRRERAGDASAWILRRMAGIRTPSAAPKTATITPTPERVIAGSTAATRVLSSVKSATAQNTAAMTSVRM